MSGETSASADLARHYDRISWAYDWLDWPFEHFRYRFIRPELCADLTGSVLDAGVGTGRNLPHYGEGVCVTGIDASRAQLSRARRRARQAKAHVELRPMDVTALDLPDDAFDACVATFLFCVLPDALQLSALREIQRVVRPGGTIRLLEYVYSEHPLHRFVMRALAPYTEAVFRARFDRHTREAIRASDVRVMSERFVFRDTIKLFELVSLG